MQCRISSWWGGKLFRKLGILQTHYLLRFILSLTPEKFSCDLNKYIPASIHSIGHRHDVSTPSSKFRTKLDHPAPGKTYHRDSSPWNGSHRPSGVCAEQTFPFLFTHRHYVRDTTTRAFTWLPPPLPAMPFCLRSGPETQTTYLGAVRPVGGTASASCRFGVCFLRPQELGNEFAAAVRIVGVLGREFWIRDEELGIRRW